MPKIIDRTGERFGRLVVLGLSGLRGKDRLCKVRCDCGNIKDVVQSKLAVKTKPIRSCGCLTKDNHYRTHGITKHDLYPIWRAMNGRCYNKKNKSYESYGGRGITVCSEWKEDPKAFIDWLEKNEYKKGLEVDRIDNNGNYNPSNCRITTASLNCRNRRNNVYVEFEGKEVLLIELAEIFSINYATLYARIKIYNMSPEKAVNYNQQVK